KWPSPIHVRRNHLPQHMRRYNASLAPEDLTVTEENHCWHTLDVVGAGGCWISIDINLEDAHLIAHFPGKFLYDGRHHFAWPAPVGVKVDKYRLVSFNNVTETFPSVCAHTFSLRVRRNSCIGDA